MGSNCSVCGRSAEVGNYCQRCYKREFPSFSFCGKEICSNEATVEGVHKFPCYSQKTRKCCECNAAVDSSLSRSYCRDCYDSKHPPPKRLNMRQGDREISLYARDGEFSNQSLQHAAYALGRGLADGRKGNYMIRDC